MRRAAVLVVSLILAASPALGQDSSMFKLDPPSALNPLDGTFRYRSPFDGKERELVITKQASGLWLYTGAAPAGGAPVLKLDPVEGGAGFKGEVVPGFDPCLAGRTQVERVLAFPDSLSLELLIPYSPESGTTVARGCGDVVVFRVYPWGSGNTVRLAPRDEVFPPPRSIHAGMPGEPLEQAGDDMGEFPVPGNARASFTANAPRADAGTRVRVTEEEHDPNGGLWLRIIVLGGIGDADHDGEAGRQAEPRSGWVRPRQVVGRVSYTLKRK